MPRKKRESMLQRQRRLRNMEKANKNASKKLPPKGGSGGNSAKAKYQRGMTRDKMAKDQLTNFARGVKRMIKQGAAQDKLNKAAKGTKGSKVRTGRAAAGKMVKAGSSKLTKTSGSLAKRGGKLARRGTGIQKSDIQRVKVKDLGPTKKGAFSGNPAVQKLKAGNKGGALAKRGKRLGAGAALGAIQAGAAIGEAYKNSNRAKAKSSRGEGRATFSSGPKKVKYPVKKKGIRTQKYPVQVGKRPEPPSKPKKAPVSKPAGKVPAKVNKAPSKAVNKRLPGKSVYDGKGGSSPAPKKTKKLSRLDEALKWASDSKNKDAWMKKKKKK